MRVRDTPKRPAAERVRDWRPIYLRSPAEVVEQQAARCMDCGVAFCHSGCPLGNLIPEWNEYVAQGRLRDGQPAVACDEQFSGVHRLDLPRAV